ncbi:ABC transporter ATP-binding protein/permease [Paenibacillus motobuensis]|uniref:ABC transporter ATP-binding protein n=1 Tax=Paenibacillus TaxID=44249 RepID=UPI00203AF0EF|nr:MULTISPECIES: ABC transporter ATP-binding protein [Paenibacillus]MCM3042047.1 ABC transporter ATP-binding protein/permease [Paenibacillus lutimineralis]MCM3649151.1 ABC transporter ATP-binding protein/permease [Paenibacillus motobuensis]
MLKKCFILFKWMILLYIIMGFMIQFLNAYGIKIFQELIDQVVQIHQLNDILGLIILYGCILLAVTLLNYLTEYPQTYLSNGIFEKLKIMALEKVSRMDYGAYQNIGTGRMIKVIENGASAGKGIIYSFYLEIFSNLLPTMIFSLLFIGMYNVQIMLVIAVGYIVIFLLTNLLLRMLYRIKSSLLDSQEKLAKYSVRGFMELVVFRLNKRYDKEIKRLTATAGDIVAKNCRIRMIHEAFFMIFAVIVSLLKIAVLVYGVKQILLGGTSIGIVVALIMFIDQVYTPVAIFNVIYVDYKLDRVAYERLEEFVNAPEDANLLQGREVGPLSKQIEFRDVSFAYGNARLLDRVSFTIPQGTSLAIVGLSGSGKSTIVKLLLGLLKKESGSILIDGVDIDQIKLNSLYDHVSYIPQDAPIFDATVRSNIVFDQEMSDEQIYELLDTVLLKGKVMSLPKGLDTMVGERGIKLSGGERQRLAFARIMAQQRELVILDEPVSALDNITEQRVMESLLNRFSKNTLLIIAHRLDFVRHMDRILLVRDGAIVGLGTFEELLHDSPYFQELWDREKRGEKERLWEEAANLTSMTNASVTGSELL